MSLARRYNLLFKRKLSHFAAWSPVTDRYEVGDFGGVRNGVFQVLGNIREFGVDPNSTTGPSSVSFSYTSSGAVFMRTQAGLELDVFPSEPLHAELAVEFHGEESFYVRTGELKVIEMPSVDAVAHQLRGREDANGRKWKRGWRVVRKVYVATNPVILASSERGARFCLSGRADALRRLEAGNASAEIGVTSSRAESLEVLGGTGPVALDLFRVRVTGRASVVSFDPNTSDNEPEDVAEFDDGWPEDLPDDDELFT